MKLWIDDVRPAPEGYLWFKGTNEALRFIRQNRALITEIALDHDAGQYQHCGGDYINILRELERLCHHPNGFWKEYWSQRCKEIVFSLHSANPVGVANMRAIIERNGWKEIR